MLTKIKELKLQLEEFNVKNQTDLETFKTKFVYKKSEMGSLFDAFREIPNDQKKLVGQEINILKKEIEEKLILFEEFLQKSTTTESFEYDISLPSIPETLGSRHPITLIREKIISIFEKIGFNTSDGPEIEDDWHNFGALNFADNHPAREMQDTFFVNNQEKILLRTHTSSVQVRIFTDSKPPIRTLAPGRVFRNEAISARAHCVFHQVEGFFVDKNVSFADLKQTLLYFAQEMFGPETKVRFRPSYFPFTEPSAELDISCDMNNPKGCSLCGGSRNICKGSGWVEIGGAGMIDPEVLKNCGINPEEFTGFAFGVGIERITMLKYRIKDLRLFTENDVRFLKQFEDVF